MKPLIDYLYPIIYKILAAKHPLLPDILYNWKQIVGDYYSNLALPVTIKQSKEKSQPINILIIEVNNSSVHLKISYQQDIILERLNFYLLGKIQFISNNNKHTNLTIDKIQFIVANKKIN